MSPLQTPPTNRKSFGSLQLGLPEAASEERKL